MDAALPADTTPPRLWRSVSLQLAGLSICALISELPWHRARRPDPVPPEPPKQEQRIRVIQIPKPPPVKPPEPRPAPPAQHAKAPQAQTPPRASSPPSAPPRPVAQAQARAPAPTPARQVIAADSTAVHGVHMRILVPRTPVDLAAHLRNSGGCMVVSRLTPEGAEVVSVLSLQGGFAVEQGGRPCNGVPRLLRDVHLNAMLGDPISRARASLAPDERAGDLVLQVLLTPQLHASAQSALHARFGAVSEEEMGRQAAQSGYELTCFAEPSGPVRCQ